MRLHSLKLLALAGLLLPGRVADAQQQAAAPRATTGLEGRWQVELFLDPRSMPNPPSAEKVSGEIAFGTDSWWGNAERFGRYAVDLRPFFGRFFAPPGTAKPFSAADTSFLTEASGGIKGDTVVIDFIPRIDHLGLTFRGRFYGDSARGQWYRRGTDGYGPFVLRRLSKEPVQVASIPDPAKQAAPARVAAREGRRATARQPAAAAAKTPPKARAETTTVAAATRPTPPPTAQPAAQPTAQPASQPTAQPVAQRLAPVGTPPGRANEAASAPPPPTPAATPAPPMAPPRKAGGVQIAVAASPLNTPAPPRTDPAATGALRVRIFDRASQRWFATKYALKLPDGNWMLANLRTGAGADGWGALVRRAPGQHEIEIGDFVCGDKIWFLKNKITRAVDVKAGETADVSVDVDVTAEPAKPSLDNKSGAKCSAPPGNAR